MADCNIKSTVSKAKKKIPYGYALSTGEIMQLCTAFREEGFLAALCLAYNFGFCRGTRAREKKRCPVL